MEKLLEEIERYIDSWLKEQRRQFWIMKIYDRIKNVKINYGDKSGYLNIEFEHDNRKIIYNILDNDNKKCIIKKI